MGTETPAEERYPEPMMASDLVEALEELIKKHGDLPVLLNDDSPVREAAPYDKNGNVRGKMVEIVLHGWKPR
jgi:hypothetical protein